MIDRCKGCDCQGCVHIHVCAKSCKSCTDDVRVPIHLCTDFEAREVTKDVHKMSFMRI